MEAANKYASVLGGRICFGTTDHIPPNTTIIIDTRHDWDEVHLSLSALCDQRDIKLIEYPIVPQFEPVGDFDDFCWWLEKLAKSIKPEDVVFCVDMNGAGRSAMMAAMLLYELGEYEPETAVNAVSEAYKRLPDLPVKWKELGAPRYCRQRFYARWAMAKTHIQTQRTKEVRKVEMAARKRRTLKIKGTARCNRLTSTLSGYPSRDPRLESFNNIQVVYSRTNEWGKLHPKRVGPVKFTTTSFHGRRRNEFAYDMHGFTLAHQVYPEEIGKDGKPNELFYQTFQELTRLMRPAVRHPLAKPLGDDKYTKPKFYWYDGIKLSFLQFRIILFSSFYAKLVVEVDKYKDLVESMKSGYNIQILTRDGQDWVEQGQTLEENMLDPNSRWDHGHVLCGLLNNEQVWANPDLEIPAIEE